MSLSFYKKGLIFGASCSLLLTSFLPQTVSASQLVQFNLEGTLEPMDDLSTSWYPSFNGINFAGASLTGFVSVNLDSYSNPLGYSALYGLDNWNIQITANTGQSVYFKSTGDALESNNLFRLNSQTNVMGFSMREYGYVDELGENGFSLGVPRLSLNFKPSFNIATGATLEDVLDGNLSLESDDFDLTYGYLDFGLNRDGYFESASVSASVTPVPEPSTLALLGLGGLMVFGLARRQQTRFSKKAKQAVLA